MKWSKSFPWNGQYRIRTKFCLFPYKIITEKSPLHDHIQYTVTYWMEWITIKERCVRSRKNAWWVYHSHKEGKHESF